MKGENHFSVTVYTISDYVIASYILAGLFELEAAGEIQLKMRITGDGDCHRNFTVTRMLLKDMDTGYQIKVAIDLHDSSKFFSYSDLKDCDIVFKRHIIEEDLETLPPHDREKIYPAGLCYGVRSPLEHDFIRLYVGCLFRVVQDTNYGRLNSIKKLPYSAYKYMLLRRQRYMSLRLTTDFELDEPVKPEPFVLFQTRCFTPTGKFAEHHKELNDQRAALIRTLRAKLGDSFKGGLIPGDIAQQEYPDCLTTLPTDPLQYTQMVKRAAITIYTHGLHYSPAWKLGEYLASQKCVVSERLKLILPAPLRDQEEIVYFDTPEHCAEVCQDLLNTMDRVEAISQHARQYYEDYVRPQQNVRRMLNVAMNLKEVTP